MKHIKNFFLSLSVVIFSCKENRSMYRQRGISLHINLLKRTSYLFEKILFQVFSTEYYLHSRTWGNILNSSLVQLHIEQINAAFIILTTISNISIKSSFFKTFPPRGKSCITYHVFFPQTVKFDMAFISVFKRNLNSVKQLTVHGRQSVRRGLL